MDQNASTETGITTAARHSSVKPRPTKAEILKATALAMHSEECKRHKEAETVFECEDAKRKAALLRIIKDHLEFGSVSISSWSGTLSIEFSPDSSHPQSLNVPLVEYLRWYKTAHSTLPKVRSVEKLLEELKEKTANSGARIQAILSDEATRRLLVEEGSRLLGGGE
jgi:hypothetical protein